MASEEPSCGQKYAIQAMEQIAALRNARPGIVTEIRWCPAHKRVPGNGKVDGWAKLAAEEPDAQGSSGYIVWAGTEGDLCSCPDASQTSSGRSRKKVDRCPSLAKGSDYRKELQGVGQERPNRAVDGSSERLAGRFYQLKTGH
jgi:hypothetical protein